jgi:carbamoyl-phosphate synthase small subunit
MPPNTKDLSPAASDAERHSPLFLLLEDGSVFSGSSFGAPVTGEGLVGEVVFNTGMVGYPESFTDPSYRGQILALTYPLIGNYGVPRAFAQELSSAYESTRVHLTGLVVSEYSEFHHHWTAERGLSDLLVEQGVPGICGIDTRALTRRLRDRGTMAGRIAVKAAGGVAALPRRHPVAEVSTREVRLHGEGRRRVAVVDCGCKNTIVRSLVNRGVGVVRLPWDTDPLAHDCQGVLFSNGPGDPADCAATVEHARRVIEAELPAFGICLGSQILALAAGARTYKLKFGHRGQNQPCRLAGSPRCYITSQNHGYAVDAKTLPSGFEEWFVNANDGTNEGIRHRSRPVMGVQFHPEAMPGPVDTGFLFDEFVAMLR